MNKVHLLIIAVVSFAMSRLLFFLVNDPEGPNLLIVTMLAALMFGILYGVYHAVTKKNHM